MRVLIQNIDSIGMQRHLLQVLVLKDRESYYLENIEFLETNTQSLQAMLARTLRVNRYFVARITSTQIMKAIPMKVQQDNFFTYFSQVR